MDYAQTAFDAPFGESFGERVLLKKVSNYYTDAQKIADYGVDVAATQGGIASKINSLVLTLLKRHQILAFLCCIYGLYV